jgi:hypothetical protein
MLNSQCGLRVKRDVEILEKRGADEGYRFLEIGTIASECELPEGLQRGKGLIQCLEQLPTIDHPGVNGNRNHTVGVLKCMGNIVGGIGVEVYGIDVDDEGQRWRVLEHLCCWGVGVAEET